MHIATRGPAPPHHRRLWHHAPGLLVLVSKGKGNQTTADAIQRALMGQGAARKGGWGVRPPIQTGGGGGPSCSRPVLTHHRLTMYCPCDQLLQSTAKTDSVSQREIPQDSFELWDQVAERL